MASWNSIVDSEPLAAARLTVVMGTRTITHYVAADEKDPLNSARGPKLMAITACERLLGLMTSEINYKADA